MGSSGFRGGRLARLAYNPKTVETISGEVIKVDRITPMRGMSAGVHLVVKTDKGDVSVHLRPEWYLQNQDVKIEPKDRIEIRGSQVTWRGKPAIIADVKALIGRARVPATLLSPRKVRRCLGLSRASPWAADAPHPRFEAPAASA